MELKVWVDGVQRVVCGLTEQTSCQDVVIALAQAIGQTGRYVLIQTLRDKERQLLPHERPLEFLAKSGQYANDVHFVLKRTGPSVAERPSSDSVPLPPERTFVRSSLPLNSRTHGTEAARSKEPKKSLTFNLGPMSSNDVLLKHRQKYQNGTAGKDMAHRKPTKEEIFKQVLKQQEQLKALEMQNVSIGKDIQTWERGRAGGPHEEDDEIAYLERLIRRNDAELGEEKFWLEELETERAGEQKRQDKMRPLRATVEDYTLKIKELSERTEALEQEIHTETTKRLSGAPSTADIEDMVAKMRRELEAKAVQSQELESNLSNVERACEEARRNVEARNQELEELNKDLRQCNLQQFILQTGSTVTNGQVRLDEESFYDQSSTQWEGPHEGRGRTESLSRSSPSHLTGHPRTLQNSLLSTRNPEVLPSRDTSWT